MKELINIQSDLKAPKSQKNNFGKYNYRSCEDILEAVKPLLKANECILIISDEIKTAGNYMYVEATATLTNNKGKDQFATAQAGINPDRKGMDIAQSFGSSSSYARKYALNGLFAIDDTKDSDATNTGASKTVAKVSNLKDDLKVKNAIAEIEALLGDKRMPSEKVTATLGWLKNTHQLKDYQLTCAKLHDVLAEQLPVKISDEELPF